MVLVPDIIRPYINKSLYLTQILIRVRTDMDKVCAGFVDGYIFISKSLCPEQAVIPIKIFWILFIVEPISIISKMLESFVKSSMDIRVGM
jgi:hypothetical protein